MLRQKELKPHWDALEASLQELREELLAGRVIAAYHKVGVAQFQATKLRALSTPNAEQRAAFRAAWQRGSQGQPSRKNRKER